MSSHKAARYRAVVEQTQDWAAGVARAVGQRVAHLRTRRAGIQGRKLTTQALADRTAELGYPMDRSVIAKLEKGHRQTITVPDVLVLAQALEVPPLLLLLPLGEQDSFEAAPGKDVSTTEALRWFLGERPLPGTTWEGLDTEDGSPTIARYRVHQQEVERWFGQQRNARLIREGALGPQWTSADAERELAEADRTVQNLRNLRQLMRAFDMTPPPLPPELAHVDGGRDS